MEAIRRWKEWLWPPRSRWVVYLGVSVLLLVPCFWQPRLQGGDLANHISNSWLTGLIESGRTEGLTRAHPWSNILFEFMLGELSRVAGTEAATRIAVSSAVLTFVWGAFAFVSVVSKRFPWHLMPSLAILAYGWVFHMGFFNFYLSLGLCFWGLALTWDRQPRHVAMAVPLFALASVAHALPVVWTAGLIGYLFLVRRLTPFQRAMVTAGLMAVLVFVRAFADRLIAVQSASRAIADTAIADQNWVFDSKYYVVLVGLLAVWALMFLRLLKVSGPREVVSSLPFQLCLAGAACVFILPGTVLIPGFYSALCYIAERMSVGVAVCLCALLGSVRPRRLERFAMAVVTLLFFGFVYYDERAQNSLQDRMQDLASISAPAVRTARPASGTGRAITGGDTAVRAKARPNVETFAGKS